MTPLEMYKDLLKNECTNDVKYLKDNEPLEAFLSALDCIPEEEMRSIIKEFIGLVTNYKRNINTPNNFTNYTQTRADKAIKSDIKIIKDYQKLIERLYPIQKRVTTLKEVASIFETTEDEALPFFELMSKEEAANANNPSNLHNLIPQELINTYEYNKKIIADLESGAFKIIHDLRYYKEKPITKKHIKEFMKELRKKYAIPSLDAKSLIDSI